jgi:hypothetical protein
MRVVLLLLILVVSVSGCASSGVNMYSMPTQRRVSMQVRKMPVDMNTPTASLRAVENKKQVAKARKSEPPRKKKTSKRKGKGKDKNIVLGILGGVLGASVDIAKVAIKTYGQKLPKIPGF